MCSCRHFCVFSFLLAMDFQRLIFIPPTLFLFIIPCETIGVSEGGCLVKMTGCACHPGQGGPPGRQGEREETSVSKVLACSQFSHNVLWRAKSQGKYPHALLFCPVSFDVNKVRGFVCLPPPNYPPHTHLGEKTRRECRLITESCPPKSMPGIRIANPLQKP